MSTSTCTTCQSALWRSSKLWGLSLWKKMTNSKRPRIKKIVSRPSSGEFVHTTSSSLDTISSALAPGFASFTCAWNKEWHNTCQSFDPCCQVFISVAHSPLFLHTYTYPVLYLDISYSFFSQSLEVGGHGHGSHGSLGRFITTKGLRAT